MVKRNYLFGVTRLYGTLNCFQLFAVLCLDLKNSDLICFPGKMDFVTQTLLYMAVFFLSVESLMFNLEPNNRKCLKEEIHKGVLVTGDYEVRIDYFYIDDGMKPVLWIHISVSDPHKFSCGSGSRIPKMSIWIRIQGGKHKRRISTQKNFKLKLSK